MASVTEIRLFLDRTYNWSVLVLPVNYFILFLYSIVDLVRFRVRVSSDFVYRSYNSLIVVIHTC